MKKTKCGVGEGKGINSRAGRKSKIRDIAAGGSEKSSTELLRGRLGEGVVRKVGLLAVRVGGWDEDDSAGWGSELKVDSLKAGSGDQGPSWSLGGAGKKGRVVTQDGGEGSRGL